MKAALVAAVVAAAVAAVPALSFHSAPIPRRVSALESKVRVLQRRVTTLTTRLNVEDSCFANVIGAGQFSGYLYTPDHGTTIGETTALDVAGQGQTPTAWIQVVSPNCVQGGKKLDLRKRLGWPLHR